MAPAFHVLPPSPRILVFRGGALGDFILTLPVFQALRRGWPRMELTLVGRSSIGALALSAGLVQRMLSMDAARFSRYFAPESPLPSAEGDFLRSFDLVISFLHDPDGGVSAGMLRAGARRVIGIAPKVAAGHAADHFLRGLAPLGLECPAACNANKSPDRLELPAALQSAGRAKLEALGRSGPVIALHPGSGSPKKNWPLSSFLALAGKIQAAGLGRVLWLAGEADAALARRLEQEGAGLALLKNAPLLEVAAGLSQCRGYVGNDSGITHLAAALGVPTLALFGPTDPAVWGPRGKQVLILQARPATEQGLAGLPAAEVWLVGRKFFPPSWEK